MKIAPGDLVQLRSGGPPMVACSFDKGTLLNDEGWLCVWSIQGAVRREILPAVCLRPHEAGTEKGARP